MLIRYPYFINILQCNKSYIEYIKFRKTLNEAYEEMFKGSKYSTDIENVKNILNIDISSYDIRKCSAIHYFHYMVCFHFDKQFIGITYDDLPKDDSITFFIINAAYNVYDTESIIIYKSIDKAKTQLLDINNMHKYKYLIKPKQVFKPSKPFVMVNNKFAPITKLSKKVYILICYNNDEQLDKCHFTIALYDKNGFVDDVFIDKFIQGNIPKSIDNDNISDYLRMMFIKTFPDNNENISELHKEISLMAKIAGDGIKAAMDDKTPISSKILNDKRLMTILTKAELPFFKLYLREVDKLDKHRTNDIIEMVCDYIHENAYSNKNFHT